jgi:hypothetical protein
MLLRELFEKYGSALVKSAEFKDKIKTPKIKIKNNFFILDSNSSFTMSTGIKYRMMLNHFPEIDKVNNEIKKTIVSAFLITLEKYKVIDPNFDTKYIVEDILSTPNLEKEGYHLRTVTKTNKNRYSNTVLYSHNTIFISKLSSRIKNRLSIFLESILVDLEYEIINEKLMLTIQEEIINKERSTHKKTIEFELTDIEGIENTVKEYVRYRVFHIYYLKDMQKALQNDDFTYEHFNEDSIGLYEAIKI